jgi:hypothetical protein
MTPDAFRNVALSLPEATEGSHMGHADFRVRGKIFATLGFPDSTKAALRLTHMQQDMLCGAEPKVFAPVPGGWGARGATLVTLKAATKASVGDALAMAWKNAAPKSLQASSPRKSRLPPR